jgi:hypothetical protein
MPSVGVSLTDQEYAQVLKAAKRDKLSAGQEIAAIVRVCIKDGAL